MHKLPAGALLVFMLLMSVSLVQAAEIPVVPGPDDPIASALAQAQPGDTIYLAGDDDPATPDYTEAVTVPAALSSLTIVGQKNGSVYPEWRAPENGDVLVVEAVGLTLTGIEFTGTNPSRGVVLSAASASTLIEDCRFALKNGTKLWRAIDVVEGSTSNQVVESHFENQSYGLWADWTMPADSGLVISGNTFVDCVAGVELNNLEGLQVSGNSFGGGSHAIKCTGCPGLQFTGNQTEDGGGILVYQSPGCLFADNTMDSKGIELSSSNYCRIVDNQCDGCGKGIYLTSSAGALILQNTFKNGSYGVELENSSALVVANLITGSSSAAVKRTSGGVFLFLNDLSDSPGVAYQTAGEGGMVFANRMAENAGGQVAGNDVKDRFATPMAITYEYGGERQRHSAGNLYGDYAGADSDGDGVGDTQLPYPVGGDGDGNPLVAPLDDYFFDLWFLDSSGALYRPPAAPSGTNDLPIAAGESLLFVAPEAAAEAVVFAPAEVADEAFALFLWFSYFPPGEELQVDLGWQDESGSSYFPEGGPNLTLEQGESPVSAWGSLAGGPLVVPAGRHLALRLTKLGTKLMNIAPLFSFLAMPGPAGPIYPAGGQLAGELAVEPPSWDLEAVDFGQSYPLTLVVTNGGVSALQLMDIQVVGPDGDDLTVESYGCPWPGPVELQAGEGCELQLTFNPATGGKKSAGILLHTSDSLAPWYYVDLAALAGPQHLLEVAIDPVGVGEVTGAGVNCPGVCQNLVDQGQDVTLVAVAGAQADFVGWTGCDQSNGATCQLTVVAATEVIAHFSPFAPDLALDPPAAVFADSFVGDTSPALTFTLTNDGKKAATIEKIAISGQHPADFAIADNGCPNTLGVGGECDVSVVFTPQADGERTAELVVSADDFDEPELGAALSGTATIAPRTLTVQVLPSPGGVVTGAGLTCPGDCVKTFPNTVDAVLQLDVAEGYEYVSWNGCDQVEGTACHLTLEADRTVVVVLSKQTPSIAVQPVLLEFGDIEVGQQSAPLQVTVTNLGNWDLELGEALIDGLFAADFAVLDDQCSNSSLAPQESCAVDVRFAPTDRSLRGATLHLPNGDKLHPSAAVALVGRGQQDIDVPDVPSGPLSGEPVVRLLPGSINFGHTGLYGGPGHMPARVCNLGGGEIEVTGISLAGRDESQFDIEDFACDAGKLSFGMCCKANIFFLATADGEKRGYAVFAISGASVATIEVPLFGVGGNYKTPSNTSTKAERGCSAVLDQPSSLAALVVLLAMLCAVYLAGRIRWRPRLRINYSILLLCFLLGSGTTTVSLSGCDANPSGTCLGSFELSGTGLFDGINTTFRFMLMATNITTGCNETQFSIVEDVGSGGYINNENFGVGLYLPSPLFPGRRYGKGTQVSVTTRGNLVPDYCYIVDGYVEVGKLTMREKPDSCNATLQLLFNIEDAACRTGGTPGWDNLDKLAFGNSLMGVGDFSYGTIPEECSPPSVEDVGADKGAGKIGQHIFPPGVPDPQVEEDLPVLYWGTEVNLLHATHMVRDTMAADGSQEREVEVRLEIEPPVEEVGNWLCPCPQSNYHPHPRCLDGAKHEPFITYTLPTYLEPGEMANLCDQFGARPKILADWDTGSPPPDIASPATGQEIYQGDPLLLKWDAYPDSGEGTVIVRAYNGDYLWHLDGEPLFEFAVADTGELLLDPAFLSVADGETAIEIERTYVIEPEFSVPLREGSDVLVRKIGKVAVFFKPGELVPFPDPPLPASGWTPPEEVGQVSLDSWVASAPVLAMGADERLHMAWLFNQTPTYRILDTVTLEWVEPAVSSGLAINNGPLGLAAGEGEALLWGLHKTSGASKYAPAVYRWGAALEGGKLEGADLHEKAWPFDAALLPDGTVVATWTNSDKLLYWSVNMGPLELVGEGYSAGLSDSSVFGRSDGQALIFPKGVTGWFLVLDPGGIAPLQQLSLGTGFSVNAQPETAVVGWNDLLHFVGPSDYTTLLPEHFANDMMTGDFVAEPTFVSEAPTLAEGYVGHEVVFGQDGTLWLNWQVECEYGICPLLYRRDTAGLWQGPYFGGQAMGTMAMAVDLAGRVHIIYAAQTLQGTSVNAPLYHTMMEVAP